MTTQHANPAGETSPQEERLAVEHSASRREFLKGLGITGLSTAVLGSVGLTLAGDIIQQETAGDLHNRPWWVKNVEQPTLGIDWESISRIDATNDHLQGPGAIRFFGEEEWQRLVALRSEMRADRMQQGVPGYTQIDQALTGAFAAARSLLPLSFLGPQQVDTPAERWQGSPEDASRIVKAAMRHMGACSVGIVELNEQTRKLLYAVDRDGKRIEFGSTAGETASERVIPDGGRWVITYAVQMSEESMKRAPTELARQTTLQTYYRGYSAQIMMQEFLRGLGYHGLGHAMVNGLGIATAFAVLGGIGELSRLNRVITPEYGPMVRLFFLITDLPLAADKPIDAGIARFCQSCKKCAEACPPSALSFEDKPGWQPAGGWNNPGHEAWFEDSMKCRRFMYEKAGTNCGICFAVCPFAKKDRSFMHDFIKMHIATFPMGNTTVRSLDDAFGYGVQKDPETWWEQDLPPYGV